MNIKYKFFLLAIVASFMNFNIGAKGGSSGNVGGNSGSGSSTFSNACDIPFIATGPASITAVGNYNNSCKGCHVKDNTLSCDKCKKKNKQWNISVKPLDLTKYSTSECTSSASNGKIVFQVAVQNNNGNLKRTNA